MTDTPADSAQTSNLSFVAIANVLLRRRRLILAAALGLALISTTYLLLQPRTYTVTSSFIVRTNNTGGAAGLAAQLGVDVGNVDISQSPDFYAGLVRMPDVLGRLADSAFVTSKNPKATPLADIWEITEKDPRARREKVITKLQEIISSSVGLRVEVVSVSAKTTDPLLSKELAEAMLVQVNRFNLQTLQSRAGAERRFAEARMAEVQGELRVAEGVLQRFLEDNRQDYLSAELAIQKARLTRKVDLLQQTFSTLATSFERARIDEVRDTPLITVVQKPASPVHPDRRGVVKNFILMLILGLIGSSALVIVLQVISWMRTSESDETREFNQLVAEASKDMSRMKRVIPWLGRRDHREETLTH